jgi:transposase
MSTFRSRPEQPAILLAIDVAKDRSQMLVEYPNGTRKGVCAAHRRGEVDQLMRSLKRHGLPIRAAFEATGDYHRPLAALLAEHGVQLNLVSSIATNRTREALYNTWDKNDPKDAQVILHLLKTGSTQIYHDPYLNGYNDLQELSKTYYQASQRKTRIYHTIVTHYLPLYFPEAEAYISSSRSEWFIKVLLIAPCPAAVLKYSKQAFIKAADAVQIRKYDRRRWLADLYAAAKTSVGTPVSDDSDSVAMFRLVLEEYLHACRVREAIELRIVDRMSGHPDFTRLQTIPGIGPVIALTILAEAGDLRRFAHHRQFLKYCGFDLATEQSGKARGQTRLSKRGNARLRCAFWMAGVIAIHKRENTFRAKYESYVGDNPKNPDLKRKAYTAVAAKVARVAHAMIKTGADYRRFAAAIPSGRTPSQRAVEALATS